MYKLRNLKHTVAAAISVALIGTLAVSQAAGFTAANAYKINYDEYLTVSDASDKDVSDVVYIDDYAAQELSAEEMKDGADSMELVDFRSDVVGYTNTALERLKPFKPVTGYVITTTGGLNVRAGESLESEILDSITYGQEIDIIGETEEWYIIPFGEDDGIGYVLKEYVTTSYEEAKAILLESVMYESGVVAVDGGALNVRSAAGTEGTMIIDQIASGDCIIVLERVNDDWMKVYYGNNYSTGYVMSQYVNIGFCSLC